MSIRPLEVFGAPGGLERYNAIEAELKELTDKKLALKKQIEALESEKAKLKDRLKDTTASIKAVRELKAHLSKTVPCPSMSPKRGSYCDKMLTPRPHGHVYRTDKHVELWEDESPWNR